MEFKKPIYPIEQWNITETEFKKENNYRNETTFALSNGYIGTRGTFEEAYPFDVDTGLEGNFVNGFYESNEIPNSDLAILMFHPFVVMLKPAVAMSAQPDKSIALVALTETVLFLAIGLGLANYTHYE